MADESQTKPKWKKDNEEIKNILIVRKHNQIGDMLCSLPMYAALKKNFPSAEITLVASKTNYQIPFFDINPYIDEVLIFDKTSIKTIFRFLRKLRKRKYQLGIVPSTVRRSRTSHIINFLSSAKTRVGVKSIDGISNKSQRFLNIKSDFIWKGSHQTERNFDVVRQIGCHLKEEEKRSIKFNFDDEETVEAKNYLNQLFPDQSRKIVGFHPGAGKTLNIWDTRKFIFLIKKLFSTFNINVLITSGWTDTPIVEEVNKHLDSASIPNKMAHNMPVRKLGALLSQIDLYITNDTGSMHIAGHSGTKMISLFGPTDPEEWAPQDEKCHFIKSPTANINDIPVESVYALAVELLKNN